MKPRGGPILEAFRAGERKVGVRPGSRAVPGTPFRIPPGHEPVRVPIVGPDGKTRDKREAIADRSDRAELTWRGIVPGDGERGMHVYSRPRRSP